MLVGNSTITIDRTDFNNSGFAKPPTDVDAGLSGNAVEFDAPARVTGSWIISRPAA